MVNFANHGEGGDSVSLRAVEFGGAECAVGVEGADLLNGAAISALRAGLIARDAVEDGSCLAAKEILGVAAAGLGFDAAEALRVAGRWRISRKVMVSRAPGGSSSAARESGRDANSCSSCGPMTRCLDVRPWFEGVPRDAGLAWIGDMDEGDLGNRIACRTQPAAVVEA